LAGLGGVPDLQNQGQWAKLKLVSDVAKKVWNA
jgi:hypothetical protein